MAIRQVTPMGMVQARIREEIEKREQAIVSAFSYVGEACIREARSNGTYRDRTGNLRSSIGYVVIKNGSVLYRGGFERVLSGAQGAQDGNAFVNQLIAEHGKGIALIVVAGMKYASRVEAMNYNVITSAELLAERMVPRIMKELGFTTR